MQTSITGVPAYESVFIMQSSNYTKFLLAAMLALQACDPKSPNDKIVIDNLVISKLSSSQVEIGFTTESDQFPEIEAHLIELLSAEVNIDKSKLLINRNENISSSIGRLLYQSILKNNTKSECTEIVDSRSDKLLLFIGSTAVRDVVNSFVYEVSIHSLPEQDFSESIVRILREWDLCKSLSEK